MFLISNDSSLYYDKNDVVVFVKTNSYMSTIMSRYCAHSINHKNIP